MNIVISGATGFLGKRVVNYCRDKNRLHLLIRDLAAWDDTEESENIDPIQIDLARDDFLEKVLPKHCDVIIHLAQSNKYRQFPNGMRDMMEVNIQGTFKLLEYARKTGCKQFIYASTGSIYDNVTDADQSEDAAVYPINAYGVTKYCGELLLRPYQEFFDILCLRIFFLYGPSQEDMLIANLIDNVRKHNAVTIQGSEGGMIICPTYVDDVAAVINAAISKRAKGVINVASPEVLSLKEAAGIIGRYLGIAPIFERSIEMEACLFRPSLARLGAWYDVKQGFRCFSEGIRLTVLQD